MIQASELRIGNLFSKFNDRTGIWQLTPIGVKDIEFAVNTPNIFNVLYDAIKITPYYLEKAGFEKSESDFWVKDGKPSFQWGEGDDDDWFITYQTAYGLDWNDAYHVRTLHQLQNLYFALTGEELEINL